MPRAGAWAAAILAAGFAAVSLSARREWERDRTVEVCVDGRELEAICSSDAACVKAALARLGAAGAGSVSVYWNPADSLDVLLSTASALLPASMSLTLRPEPPFFSGSTPSGAAPPETRVAHLLPAGPAIWGFPDPAPLSAWIGSTRWSLPSIEFSRQLGAAALLRRFRDRVVRGHSLDEEEMSRVTPAKAILRLRRAARERGIRFLYARFFPGFSREKNLAYVERLCAEFREDGFVLGIAAARFEFWKRTFPGLPAGARQFAAFLSASLLPALALRAVVRSGWSGTPWKAVPCLSALHAGIALLVAAFLSGPEFALGLETFRGVKAALVVPLALAFAVLFSPSDIRSLAARPVTIGTAGLLAAAAALGGIYVLRSGHGSFADAGGLELKVRNALESWFSVRPRFKEFMIGHPLLWLGFYLRREAGGGRQEGKSPVDPRWIVLAGFIGQLSIVNTFCHPHVPLEVSLLRTFHGLWLGALGGLALIVIAKFIPRSRPPLKREGSPPRVSFPL